MTILTNTDERGIDGLFRNKLAHPATFRLWIGRFTINQMKCFGMNPADNSLF